jgi:hypothetical protein
MTTTLGDALPAEMRRVRDDVLPCYLACGVSGAFAAAMMRASLDEAAQALASGDVARMLRALADLKKYPT